MLKQYLARILPGKSFSKQLVVILFMLSCYVSGFAQAGKAAADSGTVAYKDTLELEGFIQTSKSLNSNTVYIIRHNVKIDSAATLTIPRNTKLLFDPTMSIVVEGGLNIAGEPNAFVELTSRSKNEQGEGFLIRGQGSGDILIKYAIFSRLKEPLDFDLNWFREKVVIENNQFKEMNSGEAAIKLSTPFDKFYNVTDKKCYFSFSNNDFINNWSSIYVENFQDNVMDLHFDNNLITNNVVYGSEQDQSVPSNMPLFGYFDTGDKRFKADITNNSIFGNYQINASTDTIVREVSIGADGKGGTFNIANNFFRSNDPVYVSSTFDHFYQNNNLPLLTSQPMSAVPSDKVHAHIYEVKLAGTEVNNYSEIPSNLPAANVTFQVYFNRPVKAFGETQLESVFYDTVNNGIKIVPISLSNASFSADNKVYTFTVEKADFMKNTLGYVIVKNFRDDDGFETPDFTIGQKKAINNYSKLYSSSLKGTMFSPAQMVNNPGGFAPDVKDLETLEDLSQLGDLSYLGAYTSLAKTWEAGLFAGASNYLGTLTPKLMDKNQFQKSVGAFGQYNINKWFSVRASFEYARVSGSDINDPDYGRRLRATNFRSDIYEAALTIHWHLLQYGVSKGEKFSPSLFAGIAVFHMNPESRVFTGLDATNGSPMYLATPDGGKTFFSTTEQDAGRNQFVWVPLQPIGTEGQTVHKPDNDPQYPPRQAPKQYSLWQASIPMGVDFDFIINKSWVIGLEGGFRLTFTGYLDDVNGYYFDRQDNFQEIVEANPVIYGYVGTKKVVIPNVINFSDKNETPNYLPTAALLADPSLISAVTIDPNTGKQLFNKTVNDAYTYPNARKGDFQKDWYCIFNIKASKVFGYNRANKDAEAQNKKIKKY